jgi:probable F420-dependent oxidoreductase
MSIGRLGVWTTTDALGARELAEFAKQLERWNYSALWYPEARGREAFAHASWLLASTERLVVATGIANIYGRDAQASAAAHLTLNEQSGGRFLLGLGVSHAPLVEKLRGHDYSKPLATMRMYLEKMQEAVYDAPQPSRKADIVIAALGPKMLELSASHCDGAHPYNVTPEHTRRARSILGPHKKLYVEHKVLLESDPEKARSVARQTLGIYMKLPNYRNSLLGLGFTEPDLDTMSDRLVDALVAWGDETALRRCIHEHWEAGADHVCIQPLRPDGQFGPDLRVLELLAPVNEMPST